MPSATIPPPPVPCHTNGRLIGCVVHVYQNGKGYEVEFVDGGGHTVALITVAAGEIRPIKSGELLHARPTA